MGRRDTHARCIGAEDGVSGHRQFAIEGRSKRPTLGSARKEREAC